MKADDAAEEEGSAFQETKAEKAMAFLEHSRKMRILIQLDRAREKLLDLAIDEGIEFENPTLVARAELRKMARNKGVQYHINNPHMNHGGQ